MPRAARASLALVGVAALLAAAAISGSATSKQALLPIVRLPREASYASVGGPRFRKVSAAYVDEVLHGAPRLPVATDEPPRSVATTPLVKEFHCVSGHQTADPESPPCNVEEPPTDNGGATYPGVTADEIRVGVALRAGCYARPDGSGDCTPNGGTTDLGGRPAPNSPGYAITRQLWDLQEYFNARYQTHGRRLRLVIAWFNDVDLSTNGAVMAYGDRMADLIGPFAAITATMNPTSLTHRGVVSVALQSGAQHDRADYHGLLYTTYPTFDHRADAFAGYVCTKVVGQPVVLGDASARGKPRKFALITGATYDGHSEIVDMVRARVEACGGHIVDTLVWPHVDACRNHDYQHLPIKEAEAAARFMAEGVTTILWPACASTWMPLAARDLGYHPEWILMGDTQLDGNYWPGDAGIGRELDDAAIVVTPRPFKATEDSFCADAIREIDPMLKTPTLDCEYYNELRQLMTLVQLAGPNLGPASMKRTQSDLPHVASDDPRIAACFYDGDTSDCPRDSQALIWRQGAHPTGSTAGVGCWAAIEGGRRYLPDAWPAGNIDAQLTGNEPCDHYAGFSDPGGRLPGWREIEPIVLP